MHRKRLVFTLLAALTAPSAFAGVFDSIIENHVTDRLEVGLRISHFSFVDDERRSYDENGVLNGGYTEGISINRLDERQSYTPTIYARYSLTDFIALLLTWERIEGRAWTLDLADPHYDGDLVLEGPSLQLIGQIPNESIYTPYAGIGIVYLEGSFENEESFYDNGRRIVDGDDTTGTIVTLGCKAEVHERAFVDLMFAYLEAESDGSFTFLGRTRHYWDWPVDSLIFSLGGTFRF